MKLLLELKSRLGHWWWPMLLLLLLFYIFHQLLSGERSLFVWSDLRLKTQSLERQNAALKQQTEWLNTHVARLRKDTLDADFMDELTRRSLPLAHPSETIIFMKPWNSSSSYNQSS